MPIVATFVKQPSETKDFTLNWADDLAAGEVITAATVSAVDSSGLITISGTDYTDSTVTFSVSGGTAGNTYELLNSTTTNVGNILEWSTFVRVDYLTLGEITFITADEADEYHALAQNTTWLGYQASAREGYLVRATRVLNRQQWVGEKTSADQTLEWPRTNTGVTGTEDDVIPLAIREACAELAYMIGAGTYDVENDANQSQKLQTIKAGSVSLTYFRGAEGPPLRFPTAVQELVRPYLSGGAATFMAGMSTGVAGTSSTEDDFGHTGGI